MRLLAAALLAATALAPAAAPAQSQAVKPIAFTQRTLPNGLRVYAIRDTATPNVSVQVWYDVGSKDDPTGRSGFAHMFEHLMFKATRNLVPEQMDRLTEDVGGYNNASTNDDYTNYYEVVPANHLQRLLFAEADRMASLVVEPTTFASERDVVKEELRQNTLARPYGKLFSLYYPAAAYSKHPYARGTIGSIADLDGATIDDVRAFHATFYRPDNAVMVVSGNFDPAQLDQWVDLYFAPIAKPAGAIPRVTVAEPARTAPVNRTVYEPNTPLPAILRAWHVPADRDADNAPLAVLSAILGRGESSRLYEGLVYKDQVAQSAESFLDSKQGTGNLVVFAIVAGGKTVAAGEAALSREIARLRDAAPEAAEVKEAQNELLTASIKQVETAEGRAQAIASSVIVDGDPRAFDRQIAAIARVTPADVQRVARKYLTDASAVTIRYLPAESANGAKGDTIAVAPSVVTAAVTAPPGMTIATPAPAGQRVLPPAPSAPLAATLPVPVETRLANGLRVVTVERDDLPIVTAALVADGGAALDAKAGTASLAATLMTKGTTTRSATQIARAIESLGSSLDSSASRDGASVDVTVRSGELAPAMAILADVARHPTFAPDEIERARAQAVDAVALTVKDPTQLAGLVATRAVGGTGPYAGAVDGTPASLKAIARADLTAAYARIWRPETSALVLVGDVTPAAAKALAERTLGDWRATGAAPAAPLAVAPPAPRVIVVDMPGAAQAGIVVARPGIARRDDAYYPLTVANTLLGGSFTSRLNQEIRIKRGLAYGARSSVAARRLPGTIAVSTSTKNQSAPEVVSLIRAEMARLGQAPAPGTEEVDVRKAVVTGGFGRTIETTDGIAGIVGENIVQQVPLGEIAAFTGKVNAVDAASVQRVAARWLDPAAASVVVVGDAKAFLPDLRKAYPKLKVIPAAQVDLDKPALKQP